MAHPYWPLFDLRIRTPMLELRPVNEDDTIALAALATKGVHPPDFMPFAHPWTQQGSPQLERGALQFFWRARAEFSADDWKLPCTVVCDDEVVGVQDMFARKFPVLRAVETGSWLGQAHQGKGIGKEMRMAMLHLAFEGLDALSAHSAAFDDNPASIAVSRAVGYADNGDEVAERLGVRSRHVRFTLHRSDWDARRRDDIVIEGLEPCLELFGLATDRS